MKFIFHFMAQKVFIHKQSKFMSIWNSLIFIQAALFFAAPSFADGPDFLRLLGDGERDVELIHIEPTTCSKSVGQIFAGANGLRNYGCIGSLDFDVWMSATSAEREEARRRTWCEVEHEGIRGWVRGVNLVEDF